MTPDHREGLAAAGRVAASNEAGELADRRDVVDMMVYQLSLLIRMLPERGRVGEALRISRLLMSNTRESLD